MKRRPMHHRECAIANGYPLAGAHHQGDELTSWQGGIPRREHQCVIEEGSRRDSAIANGDPPTGARRLDDMLTPQQGGIP